MDQIQQLEQQLSEVTTRAQSKAEAAIAKVSACNTVAHKLHADMCSSWELNQKNKTAYSNLAAKAVHGRVGVHDAHKLRKGIATPQLPAPWSAFSNPSPFQAY
jgi:hypothetical protein